MNTTFLDVTVADFQVFLLFFVRTLGIVAVSPGFTRSSLNKGNFQ